MRPDGAGRTRTSRARRWARFGWLICGLWLGGCSAPSYYLQAVRGQLSILHKQRPISAVLADPSTPAALRGKLELVKEIRRFAAAELALPVDGHYLNYADLGRRYVVWNVHAAPEFSLEAHSWWYPAVGRLKYRGYFSEEEAQRFASKLAARNEDVFVGSVEAYSTLGWFHDPVLNTFIHHAPADLAEILFHELAHQKLFISGDTDFNEAFATAASQDAVRRWLTREHREDELRKYEAEQAAEREFVALVQGARSQLERLFGSPAEQESGHRSIEEKARLRTEKEKIVAQLRQEHEVLRKRWGGSSPYDRWFSKPLNNAQFNTVATYFDLVPGFEKLLKEQGGDLPKFYEAVRRLGQLSKPARRAALVGR